MKEKKLVTYLKKDGKSEIKLNDEPATKDKAKSLGWKKK